MTAGCDKAQLLAPTQSTITLSAPTRVLPSNGTTPITAAVLEQAGTPVQNGTTVRFTTTLGRVDPVEVQTTNGIAITTFFAGPNSGIAEIRANSGAASKAEGDYQRSSNITIGAAAINAVHRTLRASPGSIGPNGGTVELIATVVGENGQPLEGVLVTFNADQGSLGSTTAVSNSNGEARTTLTTSQQTIVTATAGTKTSSNLTITTRAGPAVTITCATVAAGGTCSSVPATGSNNNATVVFTVTKATGSSALRTATLDFGDGTSQELGTLAGGAATVPHTYGGSDTSNPRSYTATVLATDINGESTSPSVTVLVTPRPTPTPINVTAAAGTRDRNHRPAMDIYSDRDRRRRRRNRNAPIQSLSTGISVMATTGDDVSATGQHTSTIRQPRRQQQRSVTVTARTQDGRTAAGRTEILVRRSTMTAMRSERGYAMAALLVGMAVMAIMLGVALPVWRTAVQREREAELVFRGEQYANAIAIFQRRTGGYPPDPRPAGKDPRHPQAIQGPDHRWRLPAGVRRPDNRRCAGGAGTTGARRTRPGARGGTVAAPVVGRGQPPAARGAGPSPFTGGGVGQTGLGIGQTGTPAAGPIIGVVSRSTAASLRLYNGRGKYNEWAFVSTAATQQAGAPTGEQTPGFPGRGGPPGQRGAQPGQRGAQPGQRGQRQPGARPGRQSGGPRGLPFPGRGIQPPGRGFPGTRRGVQGFPPPGAPQP